MRERLTIEEGALELLDTYSSAASSILHPQSLFTFTNCLST
jgi:hypothetical protein